MNTTCHHASLTPLNLLFSLCVFIYWFYWRFASICSLTSFLFQAFHPVFSRITAHLPHPTHKANWNIDYLFIHFYLHQQWQLFCKPGYRTLNFLPVKQFLKQHWVFWREGGWVIIILKYLKSGTLTWCRRQSKINHRFYYFHHSCVRLFLCFRPYRRSTWGNWKPEKMFGTDLTPFVVLKWEPRWKGVGML